MAVGSAATSEAGAGTVDGASVAQHPARASSNGAKLAMVIGISSLEVKIIAVMCRAS